MCKTGIDNQQQGGRRRGGRRGGGETINRMGEIKGRGGGGNIRQERRGDRNDKQVRDGREE